MHAVINLKLKSGSWADVQRDVDRERERSVVTPATTPPRSDMPHTDQTIKVLVDPP